MLAGPVAAKGQPERAARLLGASEGNLQSLGAGLQPADQFEIDRYVVDVKNKYDDSSKRFEKLNNKLELPLEKEAEKLKA